MLDDLALLLPADRLVHLNLLLHRHVLRLTWGCHNGLFNHVLLPVVNFAVPGFYGFKAPLQEEFVNHVQQVDSEVNSSNPYDPVSDQVPCVRVRNKVCQAELQDIDCQNCKLIKHLEVVLLLFFEGVCVGVDHESDQS